MDKPVGFCWAAPNGSGQHISAEEMARRRGGVVMALPGLARMETFELSHDEALAAIHNGPPPALWHYGTVMPLCGVSELRLCGLTDDPEHVTCPHCLVALTEID